MDPKNLVRAARYRQLACAEPDKTKAAILREIAIDRTRGCRPGYLSRAETTSAFSAGCGVRPTKRMLTA
jgi:hypothetical protein